MTLGGFLQQQVGFNDRAYLTVAFRIDDNSAFGRDFEAVVYPKVSGTWVLSEESFWPVGSIGTFRVRGAFGQSGQQPDAFAALRSYQPITGPGGGAAVRPQFVGNPDLGPERGTEVELGFDASALDDRLNLEFTWYDKRAKDAIVAKPVAPSSGFIANQFVNLGEIQNTGYEVFLSGLPVETDFLRWNLGVSFARNTNEILHLGIGDEIAGPVNQYHRVGFPVSAYFEKVTVSSSVDPTTGAVIDLMCDAGVDGRQGGPTVPCAEAGRLYIGQVLPEYEGAITSDITLWNRLTISGLLDFKIGQSIFSADLAIQCTILRLCEPNIDPASNPAAAGEMAQFVFGPYVTPETSFAKFRQVAATYHVPASWVSSFGGSGATITASARNLYTFTDYDRSPEPELATVFGGNSVYQPAFNAVPHPFEFLTTVRLSF
ncbi:MAG: TonB-dependent receptor [Gemmatimonadetes bacterium]|nr:TonB-dependent receptor [Gemmatimonadota bacterium]